MAAQREITELLENIRKELPERVHEAYEEAVHQATKQGRKQGRNIARQMMHRNPWLRAERQREQQQEGALAIFAFIIGLIGGAALMYLFDPDRGAARRTALRQQAEQAASEMSNTANEQSQRAKEEVNRVVDEALAGVNQKSEQVPEAVKAMAQKASQTAPATALIARARVEVARNVRSPGAIEVSADNGVLTLSGKVLASEVEPLVEKLQALPGVRSVVNQLEVHDAPESSTGTTNNLNAAPSNGA